jgi:short-subunit dehydrogenase
MKHKNADSQKREILLGLSLAAGLWSGLTLLRHLAGHGQSDIFSEEKGKSKTALITGASSGIGAAFARQLAAREFNLVLVARREERLRAMAAELERKFPIHAEVLAADLSETAGIERVEKRIGEIEDLYLLINNAGFGAPGDFAETDIHDHLDMIHVHVVASVRLMHAALPCMIARGRGGVINVSSVAGLAPIPSHATYSATKGYLILFSEAVQVELKGTGVQIQALCPGFTRTEFHDKLDEEKFDRSGIPGFLWMNADDVAARSLDALSRGQVVYVPSRNYRLVAAAARIIPPPLIQLARSIYAG